MTINRRNAIRQLALLSAGAALLPSCLGNHSKPDLVLRNFAVDDARQRLMDSLTATLIPTTATPGATETGASLLVWKMLDDCSSKKDQDVFFRGLARLDEASHQSAGKAFADATGPQREALLTAIGEKKISGDELAFFYSTVRKLTILSYTSSPFYLTKVQIYELVPGRWQGCVPVKQKA